MSTPRLSRAPSPAVPRSATSWKPFSDGSTEKVVAALLGGEVARISPEEFDRLARLIAKGRKDSSS
jgi:hypothetical protein